jgi:hypothetical protein
MSREYYTTPPRATLGLLSLVQFSYQSRIWEPACGRGDIARLLPPYCRVVASDIEDRGYDKPGVDFLKTFKRAENIVTNPPYSLALEFAAHALELATEKVALLVPDLFLEGIKRHDLFLRCRPARVLYFARRLSTQREGDPRLKNGTMRFVWVVWDRQYQGPTTLSWIATGEVRFDQPRHHDSLADGNFHLLDEYHGEPVNGGRPLVVRAATRK